MTTNVRTVYPDTPILDAARLMRDARIGCLPVVERGGALVGIVTATDMLDLVANWLDERESRSTLGAGTRASQARGATQPSRQP
jgi:acetoin utilization protein AcuB